MDTEPYTVTVTMRIPGHASSSQLVKFQFHRKGFPMSQVTASFQLFSVDGLQVAISLVGESDTPAKWLDAHLSQFYSGGYRNEPVEGNLKPQIVPIIGYVRTMVKPLNSTEYKPALSLFSPWGDFAAISVYPEDMGSIPFKPQGKVWDGGAFDRKLVTERGYITACNLKILKEPMLDFEGKPKLTEAGNQKWRFVRVVEMDGQPVGDASAKEEPPVTPPVVKPEPTKAATPEAGQKPADPNLEAKKVIIKKFSPIAKGHYGDATWQAAVLRIGKVVAGKEIAGLAELSVFELDKLAALIDLDVLGVKIYGNANDWYDALPVLLTEFGKQTIYELSTAQIKKMANAMNDQDAAAVIPSGDEDILF